MKNVKKDLDLDKDIHRIYTDFFKYKKKNR